MNETELSRLIIEAARQVQESVGAGMDPVVYRNALAYELEHRGLSVSPQIVPPGKYAGVTIKRPEKIDMVVNDQVIVDVRTDSKPLYEAQALAQLRMTGLKLALIANFAEKNIKSGIRRVVNSG